MSWTHVALLDALYLPNVLAVVRERPGEVQTFRKGRWQPLQDVAEAVEPGHPWVKRPLSDDEVDAIIAQAGPPSPPPTVQAAVQRVAADLTAMLGTHHSRTVTFGSGVFVQWAAWGDGDLTVELPGNAVLPPHRQFGPEAEAWLLKHGAAAPHGHNPNWTWAFGSIPELECPVVAGYALRALTAVYTVPETTVVARVLQQVPAPPQGG